MLVVELDNKYKFNKAGVINDPLGQTQSASSDHYFYLKICSVLRNFEKLVWRVKIVITTARDWVGLVVQYIFQVECPIVDISSPMRETEGEI